MVQNCENLSFLPPIPWTPALCHVSICRKSEKIFYTKDGSLMTIDGTGDLMLDEKLLAFHKSASPKANLAEAPLIM